MKEVPIHTCDRCGQSAQRCSVLKWQPDNDRRTGNGERADKLMSQEGCGGGNKGAHRCRAVRGDRLDRHYFIHSERRAVRDDVSAGVRVALRGHRVREAHPVALARVKRLEGGEAHGCVIGADDLKEGEGALQKRHLQRRDVH